MTESEWLRSSDPGRMMYHMRHQRKARKRRLFACACCRRIWDLLTDERSRSAVEVAELFADGLADDKAREEAQRAARGAAYRANAAIMDVPVEQRGPLWHPWQAARAAEHAAAPRGTADAAEDASASRGYWKSVAEKRAQAALIRDIFGNPFHPIALETFWLTAAVKGIAETIYQERRFEVMLILADALEDAGCTTPQVLEHCRGKGPHVRGCFVLDLLLGKA